MCVCVCVCVCVFVRAHIMCKCFINTHNYTSGPHKYILTNLRTFCHFFENGNRIRFPVLVTVTAAAGIAERGARKMCGYTHWKKK